MTTLPCVVRVAIEEKQWLCNAKITWRPIRNTQTERPPNETELNNIESDFYIFRLLLICSNEIKPKK